MGHQSYVLLCSKITSFKPSEGQFSEKWGIFSKVKISKNGFNKKWWAYRVYIRQKKLGCHHLLLVYDTSKLISVYVVKSPALGLQRAPENSEFAPYV